MSSFQLNLPSLMLGSKEHLARLETTAGSALRSCLLSPSPAASAPAAGDPGAVAPLLLSVFLPHRRFLRLVMLVRLMEWKLVCLVSLCCTGFVGGLPVFVMMPIFFVESVLVALLAAV
jgi:hypothetical protein